MGDDPRPVDAATLKYLRLLVTVLTSTMILGLLVIIALFVIKFSSGSPALPDTITLPDGTRAAAFTQAATWYAVVTTDDRILIFDRSSGRLRQTLQID